MSTPQNPLARSGPPTPAFRFAEAWASLARTLSLYQEANQRVWTSAGSALEAFVATLDDLRSNEFPVLLSRTEVLAGASRLPMPERSNLAWLFERLERCRLAGATFSRGLDEASLLAFTRQVLDGYRRTQLDPEFELLAADVPAGISPVEQRFDGAFRVGAGDGASWLESLLEADPLVRADPLALIAARDPRVRACMARLLDLTEGAEIGSGPSLKAAELLNQIVHSLPAEATHNDEHLLAFTVDVLDNLDDLRNERRRASAGSDVGEKLEENLLGQALVDVSRRVFARAGLDNEEVVQRKVLGEQPTLITASMRGHMQDERIDDDLEALLREIEALPSARDADLRLERAEDPIEQLGVYLHYLTTIEADEEAQPTKALVAQRIRKADAQERSLLALYLEVLTQSGADLAIARHQRRIRELMRESSLTYLLADFEVLSAGTVVDLFPSRFGEWLESLDPADPEDCASLVEVCFEIGAERIRAATAALEEREGITQPERARRLLAVRDPAVAPLVRILVNHANVETRREVARFIESIVAGKEEACLLTLLDPGDLPRPYLADLLDPPADEEGRARAHGLVADTLAEMVERWDGDARVLRRRIEAVRLLATFQSRHAGEVLRKLARRGKLFQSSADSELQRAARESLRAYP